MPYILPFKPNKNPKKLSEINYSMFQSFLKYVNLIVRYIFFSLPLLPDIIKFINNCNFLYKHIGSIHVRIKHTEHNKDYLKSYYRFNNFIFYSEKKEILKKTNCMVRH
jgi:hypothetical protein